MKLYHFTPGNLYIVGALDSYWILVAVFHYAQKWSSNADADVFDNLNSHYFVSIFYNEVMAQFEF